MTYFTQHYVVDWNKVKTFEDLIRVLKVMEISFEQDTTFLSNIMDLVTLQDKDLEWTYD